MAYKANFYLLIVAGIITKLVGLGVPFILFEKTKYIARCTFNQTDESVAADNELWCRDSWIR